MHLIGSKHFAAEVTLDLLDPHSEVSSLPDAFSSVSQSSKHPLPMLGDTASECGRCTKDFSCSTHSYTSDLSRIQIPHSTQRAQSITVGGTEYDTI